MANNKDFKVKTGIQPTVFYENVGTFTSSTAGYNLSSASYDGVSFDVYAQVASGYGLHFKSDGGKMYVVEGNGKVNEYSLSTAWDITTASHNHTLNVGGVESSLLDLWFKPDGTKLYICGNTDYVRTYSLSTAWDLSTASYDNSNFYVNSQETFPQGLAFKPDGSKMYVSGPISDAVSEYDLSTAWDVTSASYSQQLDVSTNTPDPAGMYFKSDGSSLYIIGSSSDEVSEYSLSTAWDISTGTHVTDFSVASQETDPKGVYLKSDGTKMYVIGSVGDAVFQYSITLNTKTLDLSTGSVFEITPTSNIQIGLSNPAASGSVSAATLLLTGGVATATYNSSIEFADGTAPSSPANGETDVLTFTTTDGGTSYTGLLGIDGAS